MSLVLLEICNSDDNFPDDDELLDSSIEEVYLDAEKGETKEQNEKEEESLFQVDVDNPQFEGDGGVVNDNHPEDIRFKEQDEEENSPRSTRQTDRISNTCKRYPSQKRAKTLNKKSRKNSNKNWVIHPEALEKIQDLAPPVICCRHLLDKLGTLDDLTEVKQKLDQIRFQFQAVEQIQKDLQSFARTHTR